MLIYLIFSGLVL